MLNTMTEERAEETLCCTFEEMFTCVGSKCMAWRWVGYDEEETTRRLTRGLPTNSERGYCGLAGKP